MTDTVPDYGRRFPDGHPKRNPSHDDVYDCPEAYQSLIISENRANYMNAQPTRGRAAWAGYYDKAVAEMRARPGWSAMPYPELENYCALLADKWYRNVWAPEHKEAAKAEDEQMWREYDQQRARDGRPLASTVPLWKTCLVMGGFTLWAVALFGGGVRFLLFLHSLLH
jgi:hypothetical protein